MSELLDSIRDHEMRELRLDVRGHAVHRGKIERVEDENYTGPYGEKYYYVEWVEITAKFSVNTFKADGKTFIENFGGLQTSCAYCDTYMSYDLVGDTAVAKTECQYPDGITTIVEIDVFSGRLIIDDDLRDASTFDWDPPSDEPFDPRAPRLASYNSTLGQAQAIEKCAEAGLAYAPVGNSCPTLYEIEPGKYVVANAAYDEEKDEIVNAPGKEVGWFCTDLWAASMADYETFLAAGGTPIEEDNHNNTRAIIDIPPGRYRMTYHGGEKDFDGHSSGEVIYAEFEQIAQ